MKGVGGGRNRFIIYYLFLTFASSYSIKDKSRRTPQILKGVDEETSPPNKVVGVVGFPASLECDVRPVFDEGDQLLLILWYKEGQPSPIYTFDAREGGSLTQSRHYSDDTVLAQRGRLKVTDSKAVLTIDPVKREDSGAFKCRADFKKSPTKNSRINLTVLVPPNQPVIRDANGRRMVGRLGPFKVGDELIATCVTTGGNPTPKVTWWRENELIDDSFEVHAGRTTNTLRVQNVTKKDLNAVFTCQAVNNNRSDPVSTSLRLDITFPPTNVKILGGRSRSVSSGKEVRLRCLSSGSRPMPIFRWFVGGRELIDETMMVEQNLDTLVSHSEIVYIPRASDNGKYLTCRATNEYFPEKPKEDGYILDVFYVPIALVSFGPSLDPDNIREGDDVYFECHVKTNPPFYNITWRLNGKFLIESLPDGVIIGNQTLVLQRVGLKHAGLFTCIASNSEGDGESNALYLNVKFTPQCRSHQRSKYGVSRKSITEIPCLVDANPEPETFHWKFHSRLADPSGNHRVVNISPKNYYSDHDQSILSYSPELVVADKKYELSDEDAVSTRNSILRNDISGYLYCWAKNSVGEQASPCKFEIVKESRPEALRHCRAFNVTWESAKVDCRSGFDGGHVPTYVLDVYQISAQESYNISNFYAPLFELNDLIPGKTYVLKAYVSNILGNSPFRELNFTTLNLAEKRTAEMKSKPSTTEVDDRTADSILPLEGDDGDKRESKEPWWGLAYVAILCGVCVGLGILSFAIVLIVRSRVRRQNASSHHHHHHRRHRSSSSSVSSCNERRYDAVSTTTPDESDCALRSFENRLRSHHHHKAGKRIPIGGSDEYGIRRLSDCESSISSKNETKTCSSVLEWDLPQHQNERRSHSQYGQKYSTLPRLPSYDATFVVPVTDKKPPSLNGDEIVSLLDDDHLPLPPDTFSDFPSSEAKNISFPSSRLKKDQILLVRDPNPEGSVKVYANKEL